MNTMEHVLNSKQFKQALFDVQTEECEQYAALPGAQEFSPAFEQKMELLFRAQQRPFGHYTRRRKALLALAAAFILLASLAFGVSAIREPIVRFFVETYDWFFTVVLEQPEAETAPPNSLETIYLPAYLPEGFVLEERSTVRSWYTAYGFISQKGGYFEFRQYLLPTPSIKIKDQGTPSEEMMVGEYQGVYCYDLGRPTLLWQTEEYGFSIAGWGINEEEADEAVLLLKNKEALLKIACSLQEKIEK